MITAAIVIYSIGWLICSLIFGFAWLFGLGMNQDNMSTFLYEQGRLTIITFVSIWFWPVAIPAFIFITRNDEKKLKASNAAHQAKIESGFNYGKLMTLRGLPERLADYERTHVRINRWDFDGAGSMGVKPVYSWPNGANHEMVWSSKYLQELDDSQD
jgi:hypothetical protein